MRNRYTFLSLLIALGGTPYVGVAQIRVPLLEAPCVTCTMSIELVATITAEQVEGQPRAFARLSDGRILMSFYPTSDRVHEFSSNGEWSGSFASNGQGPGEVARVSAILALPDDSVMVFDPGNGRVSVFDSTGELARAFRIPGLIDDAVRTAQGALLINGIVSEDPMLVLHLFGPNGGIKTSFGADRRDQPPMRNPAGRLRRLASDGERHWTARATAYEIDEWDGDGRLVRTLVRETDWFKPYFERRVIDPTEEFKAWLMDLVWLGEDQVMAVFHVAAEDWQDHLGQPVATRNGGTAYPDQVGHRVYDTRLEVVDLAGGQVIYTHTMDGVSAGFADPHHLIFYREDESGVPILDVVRVRFIQPLETRVRNGEAGRKGRG